MESLKDSEQKHDLEGSSGSVSCLWADKCLNLPGWWACLLFSVSKDRDSEVSILHLPQCWVNTAGRGEGDCRREGQMGRESDPTHGAQKAQGCRQWGRGGGWQWKAASGRQNTVCPGVAVYTTRV